MRPFTINGCGIALWDFQEIEPGVYDASLWLTILMVPVLPMFRTWTIRPIDMDVKSEGLAFSSSYSFDVMQRRATPFSRIAIMYGKLFLGILIAVGPIASAFVAMKYGVIKSIELALVWGGGGLIWLMVCWVSVASWKDNAFTGRRNS